MTKDYTQGKPEVAVEWHSKGTDLFILAHRKQDQRGCITKNSLMLSPVPNLNNSEIEYL